MSRIVRGTWSTYRVQDDAISKGGVGSIHRTDDPGLVYKNYFDPNRAPSRDHLEKLVAVGRDVLIGQGKKPGDTPESSVNWPVDIVPAAAGGVQGVVLPIIPPDLFNDFGGVRGLEFLVMKRARPPRATGRVALLIRMAEILAFVDAKGLVHGDVNGKNLAWTTDPKIIMYLIDCDGMLPQSPRPTVGVQALGWTDPRVLDRVIPAHDHLSDRYALALAMYRGLLLTPGKLDARAADGSWPEPGKIPETFPTELATLLRRGLAALDGDGRPSPRQWVNALIAEYVPNGDYATRKLDELDTMSDTDTLLPKPVPPASGMFVKLPPIPASPGRVPVALPVRPPARPSTSPPPPLVPHQYRTLMPPTSGAQRQPPVTHGHVSSPSGRIAQQALGGGVRWYVIGVLATMLVPWVAIVYTAIGLFQMRRAIAGFPGLTRARGSLACFGGVSLLVVLIELSGALSS
jgi:hypothetical protein